MQTKIFSILFFMAQVLFAADTRLEKDAEAKIRYDEVSFYDVISVKADLQYIKEQFFNAAVYKGTIFVTAIVGANTCSAETESFGVLRTGFDEEAVYRLLVGTKPEFQNKGCLTYAAFTTVHFSFPAKVMLEQGEKIERVIGRLPYSNATTPIGGEAKIVVKAQGEDIKVEIVK